MNHSRILNPNIGSKCLYCNNPQPCFAHTPLVFKMQDGTEKSYDNLPTLLSGIVGELAYLRKKLEHFFPGEV